MKNIQTNENFSICYTDTALERYYKDIVSQDLCLKQNYRNIMECAVLDKIVCNTSSKLYASDKELILPALTALELITGQKPKYTCARKSISTFKLRQFQILGCKNSLRKNKMYQFLEKYIAMVSVRSKDWNEKTSKSGSFKTKINRSSKDYVVLNSNFFPELQQHDELFQTITGIQLSLSSNSLAKNSKNFKKINKQIVNKDLDNLIPLSNNKNLGKEKDGMLLYSAFQLIV
uniref:Ribosomal protein L5 n=1 Tax=Prototheca wickerhamii TaxID=3111 RepID=A0A873HW14_PROWI|nr:ribosomal protein L5 [Prototheca wickerhamii]